MWIWAMVGEALGAEVEVPLDRFWYTNATFLRVNPLGLVDVFRLGWRRRVSNAGGVLWDDTYTFLGASAMITPAYSRIGFYAEAQPIALLRVFAEGGFAGYYGTFDQILSWSDPGARYSDQTLSALGESGAHFPTTGSYLNFGGSLRGKLGPIAVRDTVTFTRIDLALPDGDTWFYEQLTDRLVPDGGLFVANDLDLLVVAGEIRAGVRHTFSDNLDGGSATDGSRSHHRVGPLLAWQFAEHGPGARFDQPTVFLLAQWWLAHPYRTGEEQPAGLPLVAVGFSFNGDLTRG